MSAGTILQERSGSVAILRLERPPANAMDIAFGERVDAELTRLEQSADVGAVMITGSGSCFSAGLDLKIVPTYGADEQRRLIEATGRAFARLYAFPLPTVAAINGHAIAGGLVLALCCDYRLAASGDYKIGLTEARVGVPFPIVPMSIVRAELAPAVARELVLRARNTTPADALARGIVDEIQSPDRLLPRALEVAAEMAELPRITFGKIKRQLRSGTLALINESLDHGDPILSDWLTAETLKAAAAVLGMR